MQWEARPLWERYRAGRSGLHTVPSHGNGAVFVPPQARVDNWVPSWGYESKCCALGPAPEGELERGAVTTLGGAADVLLNPKPAENGVELAAELTVPKSGAVPGGAADAPGPPDAQVGVSRAHGSANQ